MRRRGLIAVVLVLLVALVCGLAFWRPHTSAHTRLTIAVLPFTPLYADPEAQHLGDSIALRLADSLTNSRSTSSRRTRA
jgi:hypothetical protein